MRPTCGLTNEPTSHIMQMFNNLLFGRKMPRMSPGSLGTAISICTLEVSVYLCIPLGVILITLSPTASKYSHAAVWPLLAGYDKPDGKRSYPIAAMVANLAKPTPDKPALMRHDDVVTFFHEMGHVFHGLLSRTKFSRFHGTRYVAVQVRVRSSPLTVRT